MPKKLLAILFVFFGAALFLWLNLAVPPFQNPDEPTHFAALMGFAQSGNPLNPPHSEIIRLMDQNHWWRFLGAGRPVPVPNKLENIEFLMQYYNVSDYTLLLHDIFLYHFALGKLFGPVLNLSVIPAFYGTRAVSFVLIIGVLCLIYFIFKRLAGAAFFSPIKSANLGALFFVLFLPQFIILSISANPDGLSIFLGTAFFSSAFILISRPIKSSILLMILFFSAVLGTAIDRMNSLLVPLCFLAIFFSINKGNYKKFTFIALLLAAGLFMAFLAVRHFFPVEAAKGVDFVRSNISASLVSLKTIFSPHSQNVLFLTDLTDSFFLKYGWWAFEASRVFYWIWRFLITLAGIGIIGILVVPLFKKRTPRLNENGDIQRPRIISFSLLAVLIQILAIRIVARPENMYAQGRYLFPLILPIAFLFVSGLKFLFDSFSRKKNLGAYAVKIFVLLEFAFFNYVLWNDIIPVFHIILKSPHPGS